MNHGWIVIPSVALITCAIVVGAISWESRAKFKVGECVGVTFDQEFKKSIYFYRIRVVGKDYYLTRLNKGAQCLSNTQPERKEFLNRFDVVDDSFCTCTGKETE